MSSSVRLLAPVFLAALATAALSLPVRATPPRPPEPVLLIDADSGKVLQAENAAFPWHPASTSKLMTTYVTLQALKNGRIGLDTLLTVSPRAVSQGPSKMGFPAGTQLTVDNALKMMLVHSANDIAVVLAEGVDGSVEKFAEEMNATSQRLGMVQSNWVNPNGLPDDNQISSARDLAILARALMHDFPDYDAYWHIPAIKIGRRVMRNYNKLLADYPGADGMKTGFICASGFNLVASATRGNRRLIAVVLGAPSSAVRTMKAATLLERGFNSSTLSWLLPSLGTVDALQPIKADPPDLYDQTCGPHRKRPAAEDEDDDAADTTSADNDQQRVMTLTNLKDGTRASLLTGNPLAAVPPIVVYVGPKRATAVATAADDAAMPAPKPRRKKVATGDKPTAKQPATKQSAAKQSAATPAEAKAKTTQAKAAKPKATPHAQ